MVKAALIMMCTLISSLSLAAPSNEELVQDLVSLYRQERWSEFFGLSWYLRKSTQAQPELNKKISTLESIALIRHCQTGLAKDLIPATKNQSSKNFKKASLLVEKWLDLTTDTKLNKHTKDNNKFKGGAFAKKELTPFNPGEDLSQLDPHRIRRPLKDLCEEEVVK